MLALRPAKTAAKSFMRIRTSTGVATFIGVNMIQKRSSGGVAARKARIRKVAKFKSTRSKMKLMTKMMTSKITMVRRI